MYFLRIPSSILLKLLNQSAHLATNFAGDLAELEAICADLPHFPTNPHDGILLIKEGKLEDAITIFEECLHWGLSEGDIYMERLIFDMKFWQVLCHYLAGDFSKSIEELSAVYAELDEFDALFPEDFMMYCLCLKANGLKGKAKRILKKALKKFSDHADLHLFTARFYFRPGKLAKAINHYKTLVTLEPQNITCLSELALAHLLNGYDLGNFHKIREQALAQVPLSNQDYFRLGLMHYLNQDYDKARENHNQSNKVGPWYSKPWDDPDFYGIYGL